MNSYYPSHARAITEPTDSEHRIAELEAVAQKVVDQGVHAGYCLHAMLRDPKTRCVCYVGEAERVMKR